MKTNTTKYEFSHGKKPSGTGLWVFEILGSDGRGAYTSETIQAYGKFSEAKSQAIRSFKNLSSRIKEVVEIEVLP